MVYITIKSPYKLCGINKQVEFSLSLSSPAFPDWISMWKTTLKVVKTPLGGMF